MMNTNTNTPQFNNPINQKYEELCELFRTVRRQGFQTPYQQTAGRKLVASFNSTRFLGATVTKWDTAVTVPVKAA